MPVASNPVQQYVVDEWAQVINNVWIDKKKRKYVKPFKTSTYGMVRISIQRAICLR